MKVQQMFDLSGKVAIVTGASSGLGVWFAKGLAEAGADIVLAARRTEKLAVVETQLKEPGVRCLSVATDVTSEQQVQHLVDATMSKFGRIDVLVNNAGGGDTEQPLEKMPLDEVRQRFDLNLFGLWQCCQKVGQVMLEQGDGRVINVASILGLAAGQV